MRKSLKNRAISLLLAAVMLLGMLPATALADTTTTVTTPFTSDNGLGSNSYRIPALVTLSDGTLVAAADARWNTTYDGGGLDTAVAYSTNNGVSWTSYLANYLEGDSYDGDGNPTFIDPALATDGSTIYMLCDLYPYGVALNGDGTQKTPVAASGFDSSGHLLLTSNSSNRTSTNVNSYDYYLNLTDYKIYSSDGTEVTTLTVDKKFNISGSFNGSTVSGNLFCSDSPLQVMATSYLYLTKSTDKGKSWSDPTLLNLKNVNTSELAYLVGPGRGLVTSSGMIVFPCYSYYGDNNGGSNSQRLSFVYSSDGITWTRTADHINNSGSTTSADWASEAAVVEIDSFTLRFFIRNGSTQLCYIDYDLTNKSWGSIVKTGNGTNSNCQVSAITYSKTVNGQQVILVSCPSNVSNNSSASARLNGKIYVGLVNSTTKEMTWPTSISVPSVNSTNSFMYSCLTELFDGSIAILYEDLENDWGYADHDNDGLEAYYAMSFATYESSVLGLAFDSTSTSEDAYFTQSGTAVSSLTIDKANGSTAVTLENVDTGTQSVTVQSSNSNVATASASGNVITITPVAAGSATITATVSNNTRAATAKSYTLNVTVTAAETDIGNGESSNNTVTTLPTEYSGAVSSKTSTGESYWVLLGNGIEGVTSGETYLIASGSSGNVRLLSNAGERSSNINVSGNKIESEIDSAYQFTLDGSGTSWTIKDSDSTYLYPDASYRKNGKWNYRLITGSLTQQQVTISGTNFVEISRGVTSGTNSTTAYIHYNNNYDVSEDSSNLYLFEKYTEPGGTVYTVGLAGINALIAAVNADVPTEQGNYTDETWTAFQHALTAANAAVTTTAASYTTETEAAAQQDAVNTAALVLYNAWQALKEYATYTITINYVTADGAEVDEDSVTVSEKDTSYTLPATVTDADGTVYSVDSTTLTLVNGQTSYNVPVTKLEGYAITLEVNETTQYSVMDPNGDGTEENDFDPNTQTIVWTSADTSHVTTAGVYTSGTTAGTGFFNGSGYFTGVSETDFGETVLVTAQVYNANGTLAYTVSWLVTVSGTATDGSASTDSKTIKLRVAEITNCKVYYSINGGVLKEAVIEEDGGVYVIVDGTVSTKWNILLFAAPIEGYGMTHMLMDGSKGDYYTLNDGDANGAYSSAWPLAASLGAGSDSTDYTKYGGNDSTYFDTSVGMRWALAEGNYTLAELKAVYSQAIALGCTGVITATKNGSTGLTSTSWRTDKDGYVDTYFVAQKTAMVDKTVSADTTDIKIGTTLTYTITVTIPATSETRTVYVENSSSYTETSYTESIDYLSMTVTDPFFAEAQSASTPDVGTVTGSVWTVGAVSSSTTAGDDYKYTYTYSVTLNHINYSSLVVNGRISNTATLNYTFTTDTGKGNKTFSASALKEVSIYLEPVYVVDFGLPVTFTVDLSTYGLHDDVDIVSGSSDQGYGTVTVEKTGTHVYKVTYTPTSVLQGADIVLLKDNAGTITTDDYTVDHEFGYCQIIPASNVLYEETFMNSNTSSSNAQWEQKGAAATVNQHTAVSTVSYPASYKDYVYGYDLAYEKSTGESFGSYKTVTVESGASAALRTEFYGNGFDLIGNAGPNTAMLMLVIRGINGTSGIKVIVVDTRYYGADTINDDDVTVYGTLKQVPLAHADLGTLGNYQASVTAYYVKGGSELSLYASRRYTPDGLAAVMADIYEMGLYDADIEFVYFDESSPLADMENSMYGGYAMMTLDTAGEESKKTVTTQAGTVSVIDGFRVYRNTDDVAFMDPEKGIKYYNVLNSVVGASAEAGATYIEDAANPNELDVDSYESNGGPQNEIYLMPDASVAFYLTNVNAGDYVQISARAVSGETQITNSWSDGTNSGTVSYDIKHNTEMYYPVKIASNENNVIVLTITNSGDDMLALGFLKTPEQTSATSLDDEGVYSARMLIRRATENVETTEVEMLVNEVETDEPNIDEPNVDVPSIIWPVYTPTQTDVFRPENFEMDVDSYTMSGKRYVSITVDTSIDVEKLTINGTAVWAGNYARVQQKLDAEYHFNMLLILEPGENAHFEVLAYNKNGKASKAYTITD